MNQVSELADGHFAYGFFQSTWIVFFKFAISCLYIYISAVGSMKKNAAPATGSRCALEDYVDTYDDG